MKTRLLTKKIAAGDFSDEIPVSTGDEVGQLSEAFNRMRTFATMKSKYGSRCPVSRFNRYGMTLDTPR